MLISGITLAELAELLGATLKVDAPSEEQARLDNARLDTVSTDTRSVSTGDLFVALKGERFDAHDYIDQAEKAGALAVVVDHAVATALPQLIVNDTLQALGRLGWACRQRFAGSVFAVTGNSGKTTVKEMLASMLAQQHSVLATQGNLNNEIGVPLTLMGLADQQYAVVELGASALGEIARTTRLAQPHVALITNVLGAHLEGFGSVENIARAKAEIFEGLSKQGIGIVNLDDHFADFWLKQLADLNHQAMTYGIDNPNADVSVRSLSVDDQGHHQIEIEYQGEKITLVLNVMGFHNVSNAAAAVAMWVAAGLPLSAAQAGLAAFQPVKGRLKPMTLPCGVVVVDDSYNANPGSMKAAVDTLATLPAPRFLVLGDMGELGPDAEQLHADVGDYAGKAPLDKIFGCGRLTAAAIDAAAQAGADATHYATLEELTAALSDCLGYQGTLLVKGSRSAGMERVIKALQEKV